MQWLIPVLALVALTAACGKGSGAEKSVERFVTAINDSDFNDAYLELSARCQSEVPLNEFEDAHGQFFVSGGVGSVGFFVGGGELRAEDVEVVPVGGDAAQVKVDWILHSSLDNPFPFQDDIFTEDVPLNAVLDAAGSADAPLNAVDDGDGDWRFDDCDPLGVIKYIDEQDDYEQGFGY